MVLISIFSLTIVYAALSPLGEEYSDVIYKAFNEKWIDAFASDDKVSGAYCMSIYNNHPYINPYKY